MGEVVKTTEPARTAVVRAIADAEGLVDRLRKTLAMIDGVPTVDLGRQGVWTKIENWQGPTDEMVYRMTSEIASWWRQITA